MNHSEKLIASGNAILEPCFTCDGSGEVHSHNSLCWSCKGKRKVTASKNKELKEDEKHFNTFHKWTGDYE